MKQLETIWNVLKWFETIWKDPLLFVTLWKDLIWKWFETFWKHYVRLKTCWQKSPIFWPHYVDGELSIIFHELYTPNFFMFDTKPLQFFYQLQFDRNRCSICHTTELLNNIDWCCIFVAFDLSYEWREGSRDCTVDT